MISFLPWFLLALLSVAHGAPSSAEPGLRAVKAGTKHAKGVKRRTLQEWREEQKRLRAEKAREKKADAPASPPAEEAAPEPVAPDDAAPEARAAEEVSPSKSAEKPSKASGPTPAAQEPWYQRYAREMYGLLALLTLWLIARIFGQTSTKNAKKPPRRPSPVSAEELGRILFGIGRSSDVAAYRSLFLNGAEAMQILGADHAERYLSGRSLAALEVSCGHLATALPSGTSYLRAEVTPTHQCILHVANPDGSGRSVQVGTVAQVGAVLRLVAPMVDDFPITEDAQG